MTRSFRVVLAQLVAAVVCLSGRAATLGSTYSETISFPNPPNVAVISTNGLNVFGTNAVNFKLLSFINTDAAGKLSGLAALEISNSIPPVYNYFVWVTNPVGRTLTNGPLQIPLSDTNSLATNLQVIPDMAYVSYAAGYEDFIVDIAGSFGSSSSNTTLTLTIKGNGYMVGTTNADGTITPSDRSNAFPAAVSLKFSGRNPLTNTITSIVVTNPDTSIVTNTFSSSVIHGILKGTISSKLKIINAGKPIPVSVTNDVPVTFLGLSDLTLNNVVQFGEQIAATGSLDFMVQDGSPLSLQCSGNNSRQRGPIINLNMATTGNDAGATFVVTGDKGAVPIQTESGTAIVPSGLATNITLNGKVFGQTIKARGGTASFPP
jgi:hypothetical protein